MLKKCRFQRKISLRVQFVMSQNVVSHKIISPLAPRLLRILYHLSQMAQIMQINFLRKSCEKWSEPARDSWNADKQRAERRACLILFHSATCTKIQFF